jgi:predicted HicB family RNase H-like nuclease
MDYAAIEIRIDFENAVDFYLETTESPEKPFEGFITLQISPELHTELFNKAKKGRD